MARSAHYSQSKEPNSICFVSRETATKGGLKVSFKMALEGAAEREDGAAALSSRRPWWDLCGGARYTAFSGGGAVCFQVFTHSGVINILKDGIFLPRIEIMNHT